MRWGRRKSAASSAQEIGVDSWAFTDRSGQGLREPEHHAGDAIQAGDKRRETLAKDPGIPLSGQGHRRSEVQRRSGSEVNNKTDDSRNAA